MRILGLDYGTKTVGVAISDPFGWTAQGLFTIKRTDPKNLIETIKRIKEVCEEYSVEKIVVGMPVKMDSTKGQSAINCEYFANRLTKELGIDVVTFDERYTTLAAKQILDAGNVKRYEQKKYIDKIAAVLILENYLRLNVKEQ